MNNLPDRLIIFARNPEPGKVKTRLIPALGSRAAADLYCRLVETSLMHARSAAGQGPWDIEVCSTGGRMGKLRKWLGRDLRYSTQSGRGLGQRLSKAFRHALGEGCRRVVVIGTDCPGLSGGILQNAFAALDSREAVLGPAADGGYYLIGLTREAPALFKGVSWGTAAVLSQTLERAQRLRMVPALLQTLHDVDRPEDMAMAEKEWRAGFSGPTKISVIIPTLNEALRLETAFDGVRQAIHPGSVDVIVSDGGSGDSTSRLAQNLGARLITGPRGRAQQMNAGAAQAQGEILLFLHADTRLAPGWDIAVRHLLSQPGVAAGAFEFRLDKQDWRLRTIERWTNRRSRRLGLPYGDQGLFLKRSLFEKLGGFSGMPIMEDFAFVRRLHRYGRVVTAWMPAVTSAERWQKVGVLRTLLINQAIILGYVLGIPLRLLAQWYYGASSRND